MRTAGLDFDPMARPAPVSMGSSPMWVEIGAALQAARKRRREQRKVTAHRIDTTPTSLDDYEAGARAIPERCWPKVLAVYGIDIAARVAEWRAR